LSLNLSSIIFQSAKKYPNQAAFADGLTFKEVAEQVKMVGTRLLKAGIQPGDRVGLMSENRPEFTVAYFGILAIGAVVVPISILLSTREILFCLKNAGSKALICSKTIQEKGAEVKSEFDGKLNLVCLDNLTSKSDSFQSTDSDLPYPSNPEDTAVIFYTSGTTGAPKGAEVTHYNLFSNAQWVSEQSLQTSTGKNTYWGTGHCTLAVLALSHSFGQTCMQNAPLMNGGCVAYAPRFEAKTIVQQMKKQNVSILAAVPRMISEMLALCESEIPTLDAFQYCLVGGAPIDQEVAMQFEQKFGVKVLEGYGLSETSPVVAFRTPQLPRKKGSVGRAISGVEFKVVDDDGGILGNGKVGELLVKGNPVMKGYYQNKEATDQSIQNGWFFTGDLAYLDEDGDVYLVDRKKDLIIRNGYNIYPAEVESVLSTFPGVIECAVVGVPDADAGEEIKAFIVGQCEVKELIDYCKKNLASFKYPRKVEFVASLPKGSKGQILRRELRGLEKVNI